MRGSLVERLPSILIVDLSVINIALSPEPVEDITQHTKRRRADRPTGPPRLLNGRAVYNIWSYQALRDECVRRNIPLPNTSVHLQKASLEKRLRLHDGLEDYSSSKRWTYKALQEECSRRGLPIASKRGTNTYKRSDLIKILESNDVKQRQEAASAQGSSNHDVSNEDINLPDAADDLSASAQSPNEEDTAHSGWFSKTLEKTLANNQQRILHLIMPKEAFLITT